MIIKDLMKKPLVIDKDISLKKAADLMKNQDISSLLIMSKNKIKGIITQEDLVENFDSGKMISAVMSKKVVVVYESDTLGKAVDLIKENKISVLPVLNDNEKLVGIVDVKDLIEETSGMGDFLMN